LDLDLSGRRALITGSTRGNGLAVAKALAMMGAEVIVNGRTDDGVERAMDAVLQVAPTGAIHGMAADISDADGCDAVIFAFPKIDILFNNMAVQAPGDFFDLADQDWRYLFDANVMSGIRLTRYYLKDMLRFDNWGRVVFFSEEAAGLPAFLAKSAAKTTIGSNINVNSMLLGSNGDEIPEDHTSESQLGENQLGENQLGEAASLIRRICFTGSDAPNGATLWADGGIIANPLPSPADRA
jgi:NAD(P)-dependent dehydrogenase (short-subunit alcohol dehydrogenase family)